VGGGAEKLSDFVPDPRDAEEFALEEPYGYDSEYVLRNREGFIAWRPDDDGASILIAHAYTIPDARGKGVFRAFLEEMKQKGQPITLNVDLKNPAINTYKKYGFIEDGPAPWKGYVRMRLDNVSTAQMGN
jgi:GNAT superfamily N-acetyltransferase